MRPAPANWPRLSSSVFYRDAAAAIDFLCRAFGFSVRLKVEGEGGRIEHSELTYGEALVMVGQEGGSEPWHALMKSPASLAGANSQSLCIVVDDPDAHCAQARTAGAEIVREPATSDYGEDYDVHRSYGARDPEGHLWFFLTLVREARRRPS